MCYTYLLKNRNNRNKNIDKTIVIDCAQFHCIKDINILKGKKVEKTNTSPIGDLGENLNLNTFAANTFNAAEPDYKEVIVNANLRRRMNRMLKMGTYAAMKCLADTDVDMMLTATSLGSISDTEKMLDTIYSSGETLGNPTAFIQSTFNTLAGNIAQLKSTHIPNVTFVNRGETVANALRYAQVKLSCDADNILYVSSDEKTELSETVLKKFNLSANGMYGEGSTAMILSSEKTGALAEIVFSKCGIDVQTAHGVSGNKELCTAVDLTAQQDLLDITAGQTAHRGLRGGGHHLQLLDHGILAVQIQALLAHGGDALHLVGENVLHIQLYRLSGKDVTVPARITAHRVDKRNTL